MRLRSAPSPTQGRGKHSKRGEWGCNALLFIVFEADAMSGDYVVKEMAEMKECGRFTLHKLIEWDRGDVAPWQALYI